MKNVMRNFLKGISPRQRALFFSAAATLGATLYVVTVLPLTHMRDRLRETLPQLRMQGGQLEQQIAEYMRLNGTPVSVTSKIDLQLRIKEQVEQVGLPTDSMRIETLAANQIKIEFESIPFEKLLIWVSKLQTLHIQIERCRVEALTQPGQVKGTIVVSQPFPT